MMRTEFDRKSIHIFSAAIPLAFLVFPEEILLPLLITATVIFITVDFFRRYITVLDRLFSFFASWGMREEEETRHKLTGATWMMFSMPLVFILFPVQIAVVSMLLLHWGDAAAALVGKTWGKYRWTGYHTVEGSLAFILVGLTVFTFGFPQFSFFAALITVVLASLAESVIPRIDDNFLIPLVAASCLSFFSIL